MGRRFLSHQLIEAELELSKTGRMADELGFELGEMADEIHFDGAAARPAEEALITIRELKRSLERAEGLVRAYQLGYLAEKGTL